MSASELFPLAGSAHLRLCPKCREKPVWWPAVNHRYGKLACPNGHHVTAEASPEANAYDWNIWSKETAAEMRNKKERNTEASEPGPGVWFSLRK